MTKYLKAMRHLINQLLLEYALKLKIRHKI